jgi:hypothetical protein
MWVKRATALKEPARKPVTELLPGEIFSLNEKSKKFAFFQTTGAGEVVAQPVSPTGQLGNPTPCPMCQGLDILVHPELPGEPNLQAREYQLYDRVQLKNAVLCGTIIDINANKFPDVDIAVLWDEVTHGNIMTEVHPHEIVFMQARAEGTQYDVAKEAREFLRNIQDQYRGHTENQVKQEVVSEAAAAQKRREDYSKQLDTQAAQQISAITEQVISTHAAEFKNLLNAGILRVTAGPYDYEVDEIPKLLNDYAEFIYAKVSTECPNLDLRMSVTARVMTQLASMIYDSYKMTRDACIRKGKHGGYGVFSNSGQLMGKFHHSKRGALQQIRAKEYWTKHKD